MTPGWDQRFSRGGGRQHGQVDDSVGGNRAEPLRWLSMAGAKAAHGTGGRTTGRGVGLVSARNQMDWITRRCARSAEPEWCVAVATSGPGDTRRDCEGHDQRESSPGWTLGGQRRTGDQTNGCSIPLGVNLPASHSGREAQKGVERFPGWVDSRWEWPQVWALSICESLPRQPPGYRHARSKSVAWSSWRVPDGHDLAL